LFLKSPRGEKPENAIKHKRRGKTNIKKFVGFFGKHFRHGLFAKNVFIMFLISPCQETPENVLKTKSRKKVGWWASI
jgi:hypothetical protein